MKTVLKSLLNISSNNPTKKKILVMQSYSAGLALINSAATSDINLSNIKAETPLSLAEKVSEITLFRENKKFLDKSSAKFVVLNIFKQNLSNNNFRYFTDLSPSIGVISEIESVIYELKMAGYNSSSFPEHAFIAGDKGSDVKLLLNNYEEYLASNNYLDEPDLYDKAVQLVENTVYYQDTLFIIPSNLELYKKQSTFLNKLAGNNQKILKFPSIKALNIPDTYYSDQPCTGTPNNAFSWLYELNNSDAKSMHCDLEIYRSYGESNEAKKIIRIMRKNNIKLDNAAIYTTSSIYNQILYDLSCQYNLPMTFAEGINVSNSSAGKLFLSFLEWISDKYSVPKFCSMITSGFFKLKNDNISPFKTSKVLKETKIAWGRKRYIKILEEKIKNTPEENEQKFLYSVITELNGIFSEIPELHDTGNVSLSDFTKGLINILKAHTRIRSEMDASALITLTENLTKIAEYSSEVFNEKEVIKMLKKSVSVININASSAKPGHIHVTHYEDGVWINRKHNFFIGLDAEKLPGKAGESPFMLDVEKEQIGHIQTSTQMKNRNIYKMTELLANTDGKIYVLFTNYDTEAARLQSPSSLLLQIYRLKEKINGELLNTQQVESYLPFKDSADEILDDTDLWMHKAFYAGGIKNKKELFAENYPEFNKGILARDERVTVLNEYNGCELDISKNTVNKFIYEKTFSNTKLESMGGCPLKFFFSYLLYLKPLEEYEYNQWQWLDALERGTLLHRIFELFYTVLLRNDETPEFDKHIDLLETIAVNEAESLKNILHPPSEAVYNVELEEILNSCRIFLQNEVKTFAKESKPAYLELYFGNNPDKESSNFPPVKLSLPSGRTIYFSGRIDRVDMLNEKTYRIIDYKTGSTRAYSMNEYFKKGRQLQHALYALAFEKLMGDNSQVSESGYYFPTTRGNGYKYMYPPISDKCRREDVLEIVDILLDNISNCFFPPAKYNNDNDTCKFCDYNEICEREKNDTLTKLLENEENKYLQNFRRIEDYE